MKLEILKDNKTTNARVGTVMLVPKEVGKAWCKKGFAKDISNAAEEPTIDEVVASAEDFEIIIEDDGSELDQEPKNFE